MVTHEEDFIDLLDLVSYTCSNRFIEKWRHRFSERFLVLFQEKLIESMKKNKPIKRNTLTTFYTQRWKYSITEVENFYQAIEIDLYSPIIF